MIGLLEITAFITQKFYVQDKRIKNISSVNHVIFKYNEVKLKPNIKFYSPKLFPNYRKINIFIIYLYISGLNADFKVCIIALIISFDI